MRFLSIIFALLFIVVSSEAQILTPVQTLPDTILNDPTNPYAGYKIRNGWQLDSVLILFDGANVQGLGTMPTIRRFYQGVQIVKDSTSYVVPEVGIWCSTTDSASVWQFGLRQCKDQAAVLAVIKTLAWQTDAEILGISDSTIANLPEVVYPLE
jgi:hypothetical protein